MHSSQRQFFHSIAFNNLGGHLRSWQSISRLDLSIYACGTKTIIWNHSPKKWNWIGAAVSNFFILKRQNNSAAICENVPFLCLWLKFKTYFCCSLMISLNDRTWCRFFYDGKNEICSLLPPNVLSSSLIEIFLCTCYFKIKAHPILPWSAQIVLLQ